MAGRLLLLVSPMLRGADVRRVQDELEHHGFDVGPVDGVFGPATEYAVRRFQRHHGGLAVDGVVGPHTRAALEHRAGGRPPAPPPHHAGDAGTRLGEHAVRWMVERAGMGERPANVNPITREFRLPGQPWCAMAVSLAFKHGERYVLGKRLADAGHPPAGYWRDRGFAYVPYLMAWAQAAHLWIGKSRPRRGDIVIYRWEPGPPDHTGLVTGDLEGGRFRTVEGNTSDTLGRRSRAFDETVVGFIRVHR